MRGRLRCAALLLSLAAAVFPACAGPAGEQASARLKVLVVGNSFSDDACEYLYKIAASGGVKEIVLGNLFYGGCSLAQHALFARKGMGAYVYRKNDSDRWTGREATSLAYALLDEAWDVVVLQQASGDSGDASSYGESLAELVRFVRSTCPNDEVKLAWHMTWAYQQDLNDPRFALYGNDQLTMYRAICAAVRQEISEKDFSAVIPAGTAVQNARTGFVGDTLTRDGYHLSLTLGRYVAGLCMFRTLTGISAEDVAYAPEGVTERERRLAAESVENAVSRPFDITKSELK